MKTQFVNLNMNLQKLIAALVLCFLPFEKAQAHTDIEFIFQPLDQNVSAGADVIFLGMAFSFDPLSYQWRKDGQPLLGQTNDMYYIPSATGSHEGSYDVVVSSSHGSVTSAVAQVTVDLRFTKIIDDPLVNAAGFSSGVAWGDFDNDGDLDAFITKGGADFNTLYRNNGGTFEHLPVSAFTNDIGSSTAAAWADYDNDGWLDLIVVNTGNQGINFLYKNLGSNNFERITTGVGSEVGNAQTVAWGDYNLDGWVDLMIAPIGQSFFGGQGTAGLYRNTNGVFTRITTAGLTGLNTAQSAMWVDYNNDFLPDLFYATVPASGFFGSPGHEQLYRNTGTNVFAPATELTLVSSGGASWTASWADYDGDGLLDVFVGNGDGEAKHLFRQNAPGNFSLQEGEFSLELGATEGSAWGDYDNDGWLDLLVVNNLGHGNFIFRNLGNGGFEKVEIGSLTGDRLAAMAATWVDINNDGFLDLYVANNGGNDALYRNNGNDNGWVSIQLNSYRGNRSGIGARVKVLATINGVSRWQMREIASRDSTGSPNSLRAEFGLGDAEVIEAIQVQWPSGQLTELASVAKNQLLTLSEPATISILAGEVLEGDEGFANLVIPVLLREPSTNIVSVDYSTRTSPGITGVPGVDYIATNGTLTFAPGTISNAIVISVFGNLDDQQNRTILVGLSNAINTEVFGAVAVGTIIDDDPLGISIDNTSVLEGDEGATPLQMRIWLSKPSTEPVTLDWRTVRNTAAPIEDFIMTNGSLVFNPGEMEKFVEVMVVGDNVSEPNEILFLNILNISGATPLRNAGNGIILNDEPSPVTINVSAPSSFEGNSGSSQLVFAVELSSPSSAAVSFSYATANGTAVSTPDYTSKSGTITFAPRTTSTNIAITINGDTAPENHETFSLLLSNPTGGAVFADSSITATIMDDDQRLVLPVASSAGVTFGFNSINNQYYRIEWSPSFSPPEWQVLPGYERVRGNGSQLDVVDSNPASQPHRFYRIIPVP